MILAVCANPSVDSFWSIPSLAKRTTNRSQKETYFPGGKGIHAAFALHELGEEVTVLGIWGGQTGDWLKYKCEENGIHTIGPTIEQWNRLCLTFNSNSDWNDTELLGSGPSIEPETSKAFESTFARFVENENPDAVMLCGSIPKGMDQEIYHRLITCANQHDVRTFLDSSDALLHQSLHARPYSVHINLKEGQELSGLKEPAPIAQWLAQYCSAAAVTAGGDGLFLCTDGQLLHSYHRLDSSKIISTIGAGDCLFAGLCFATLKYEAPEQWAKFAAACGSANCMNPALGMLKKKDVEVIINQVKIKRLNI